VVGLLWFLGIEERGRGTGGERAKEVTLAHGLSEKLQKAVSLDELKKQRAAGDCST
jgi:Tfp pilus assembly protein PilO